MAGIRITGGLSGSNARRRDIGTKTHENRGLFGAKQIGCAKSNGHHWIALRVFMEFYTQ
jgi:hypothetical protein